MPSIPGGQYSFFATGENVNVITTPDGSNLPPAIAGMFNLELVTSMSGPSGMPPGYQGVALESADGKTIDRVIGDYGVRVTGDGAHTIIAGTGNDTIYGGKGADMIIGGPRPHLSLGRQGEDKRLRRNRPGTTP